MFIIAYSAPLMSASRSYIFPYRICDSTDKDEVNGWWRPESLVPLVPFSNPGQDVFAVNSKLSRLLKLLESIEYIERLDLVGQDQIDIISNDPSRCSWENVRFSIKRAFQLEVH